MLIMKNNIDGKVIVITGASSGLIIIYLNFKT